MATLPGRIRRISLDAGTPANYTLQATTTYVAATPAVSPSSWGSSAEIIGMDQLLGVPSPPAVEVTGNMGALVTFTRFPKYMTGVIVKVRPTYDADAGQDPYLEYWTYDNIVAAWTLRQSVALRSEFDGVKSGRLKYFDFRTDTRLENVTAVWVTLKEGAVAGATLSWLAVHVFGACGRPTIGGGGGGLDPNDPGCTSSDCITPDPCEGQPESCVPTEDTCRDLAIRYGYDPDICDLTPDPDWDIPEFPLIDFCDPVAMAAFRATLTPLQLSWLEELLEAVELPCLDPDGEPDEISPVNEDPDDPGEPLLPGQPVEDYVDPEALNPPGEDPDPRAADETPAVQNIQLVHTWWFFDDKGYISGAGPSGTGALQRSWFASNYANYSPEVVTAWEDRDDDFVVSQGSPGPDNTGINIEFFSKIIGTRVGVRVLKVGHHFVYPGPTIETSEVVLLSKDVHDGVDLAMVNTQQGVFATPVSVSSKDTLGQAYYNLRVSDGDTEFDLRLSSFVAVSPGVYSFPGSESAGYWVLVTLLIRTPISSGVGDLATNATMYGGGGA